MEGQDKKKRSKGKMRRRKMWERLRIKRRKRRTKES